MKKLLIILGFLLCCGCSSTGEYQQITCNEITSDMIVIDVRSAAEFKFGHLDNAINIDVDNLNSDSLKDISKDSKIVVYCQTGSRSKDASEILLNMGYKNVYDLGAMSNCQNS